MYKKIGSFHYIIERQPGIFRINIHSYKHEPPFCSTPWMLEMEEAYFDMKAFDKMVQSLVRAGMSYAGEKTGQEDGRILGNRNARTKE